MHDKMFGGYLHLSCSIDEFLEELAVFGFSKADDGMIINGAQKPTGYRVNGDRIQSIDYCLADPAFTDFVKALQRMSDKLLGAFLACWTKNSHGLDGYLYKNGKWYTVVEHPFKIPLGAEENAWEMIADLSEKLSNEET